MTGLGLVSLLVFFQLDTEKAPPAVPPKSAPQDSGSRSDGPGSGHTTPEAARAMKPSASESAAVHLGPHGADPEAKSHLRRSREFSLDQSLAAIATAYRTAGIDHFTLPGFDGNALRVAIRRVTDHSLGGTVLRGQVAGEPSSEVILAEKDGAISGAVRWPSKNLVYEIRPLADGAMTLGEVDLHALGECGLCAGKTAAAQVTP